jgi:nucleoside-diphosphate-sugar epimerase
VRKLNKYYNVIGVGRDKNKLQKLERSGVKCLAVDLSDPVQVKYLFQKKPFDIVIHCAGYQKLYDKWNTFYNNNVMTTINLVNESMGCRFIYISSSRLYLSNNDTNLTNITEDHPFPVKMDYYCQSKLLAEHEVKKAKSWVILRVNTLWGNNNLFPRSPRIMQLCRLGNPSVTTHLSHIDNVKIAIEAVFDKRSAFGCYNIADKYPTYLWKSLKHKNMHRKVLLMNIALMFSYIASALLWFGIKWEPPITPYEATLCSTNFSINIDKAKKRLKYFPSEK